MVKNIGILGGAFDPIHEGHIQVANAAMFWFDEVWLMPAYSHIFEKEMASTYHRLNMCQFAKAKAHPCVSVSAFEIANKITNGSFEMLKKLVEEHPNSKFSFIIGQDNADCIDRWRNSKQFRELIPFLVFPRKGYPKNYDMDMWYMKEPHKYIWNIEDNEQIDDTSSSKIREDIAKGVDPENLDPLVAAYIKHYKLYQK